MKPTLGTSSCEVAIVEPVGGHGGMNYYDFALCEGLVGAGVTPTLYTSDETVIDPHMSFAVSLVYRRIYGKSPAWLRGFRFLRGSIKALVTARLSKQRLVHFHLFEMGLRELFNIGLAKLLRFRIVITAHDVEAFRSEWSFIKSWVYARADGVIAHNLTSKRELVRVVGIPDEKIHVIPHGHYLTALSKDRPVADAREQLNIPGNATVLLFFGQIKEVKGLDLLLDAMATIKDEHPELLLVIAGKTWGQDFQKYQSQIEMLGLEKNCICHIRYIPDTEVATYYAAADLVILPYRKIYQSGVLLMAMSYGKPVLASDLDGMKEVIKDGVTGFLFPAGDASALAHRLRAVLADRAGMQRVAHSALHLMRQEYDWGRIGKLTAACYQRALQGRI